MKPADLETEGSGSSLPGTEVAGRVVHTGVAMCTEPKLLPTLCHLLPAAQHPGSQGF